MQLIGFHQQATAYLLSNYLNSQSIPTEVTINEEKVFVVTLLDHSKLDEAIVLMKEFIQDQRNNKYQDAAWQQGEINAVPSHSGLPAFNLGALLRIPIVATVLLVCCAIFTASWLGAFPLVMHLLMILPLNELSSSQEWWRLITPAFIHFSVLHIVFNLLWWWILGRQVEQMFGSAFLLLFLVLTAVISNVAQLVVSGPNFGGLSGVVYALMGFVWWIGWLKPQWGLGLPKSLVGFMLVWLMIGFADVLWVSMANTAHTVGLVSGCIGAWLMAKLARNTP